MHIVTFSEDLLFQQGATMKAGVPYYMTNGTCGLILDDHRRIACKDGRERAIMNIAQIKPAVDTPFDPKKDWNGRTIHMFRGGGWGDIMFLGPTVRELRRRWPKVKIHIHCGTEYIPALDGLDVLATPMPVAVSEIKRGDAAVFYEGTIEASEEAERQHAVQLFAAKFGMKLTDLSLEWELPEAERLKAWDQFPRSMRKRVGIQVAASSPVRTYHPQMLASAVDLILAEGYEVFLFGRPGQFKLNNQSPLMTDLSEKELSMRESVATMTTCDVMVTPDSSLFHVAQALGIPVVGLFGSFRADLRVTDPSKALIIQAQGSCAPCFFHANQQTQFPEGRPCSIAKFCTVLAAIPPAQILKGVQMHLGIDPDASNGGLAADPVKRNAVRLKGRSNNPSGGARNVNRRRSLAGSKK